MIVHVLHRLFNFSVAMYKREALKRAQLYFSSQSVTPQDYQQSHVLANESEFVVTERLMKL
jgi:hypothetical protein